MVLYSSCTIPIWFFTYAYTGCQYTIMALTSPQSKVCTYGSIWFPYGSYTVLYTCLHRVSIYHNGIDIPSFQSSHIRFYMVPVWFLYSSLHMPTQVSIYHDDIDHPLIPKFAHTVLYSACTVPIRFFTHAYTGCQYTIMALTSPHSKIRTYGSIRFFTHAYTGIHIP